MATISRTSHGLEAARERAARVVGMPRRAARRSSAFVATLVVLLVAWEVLPRALDIHQIVLPPLSRVLEQLATNPGVYATATLETFWLVLLGFTVGAAMGIAGAIGIFYSEYVRRAIYPYIFAFRIVPKLAFLPLFLLWFGVGSVTKVVLAASAIFFLVLVQMLLGLYSIDDELVELGRSLKMRESEIFRKIRVPVALPSLMVGVKLGITYAMTNVIVAEMVVAQSGLGVLLVEGRYRLRTYEVLAGILVIGVAGLVLYGVGTWLEQRTTFWHYDEA